MRTLAVAGLAVLIGIQLAACGGGDKELPSGRTPSSSDLTSLATRAVPTASDAMLEAALLTPEDLGEGWRRQANQGGPATVADNIYCAQKVEAVPFTASAIYANEDIRVIFMIQAFSKLATAGDATEYMDATRKAVDGCDQWVSTDGVSRTEWQITSTETRSFGDDTLVLRAKTQFEGAPEPSDAYFAQIRYGSTIMFLAPVFLGDASLEAVARVFEVADARFTRLAGDY